MQRVSACTVHAKTGGLKGDKARVHDVEGRKGNARGMRFAAGGVESRKLPDETSKEGWLRCLWL